MCSCLLLTIVMITLIGKVVEVQQSYKDYLNVMLEKSNQKNFFIISICELEGIDLENKDATFIFNNQQIEKEKKGNYLNITKSMIEDCPDYVLSDLQMKYKNCTAEIKYNTELELESETFKYNYLSISQDWEKTTQILDFVQYPNEQNISNSENNFMNIFPHVLNGLFTFEECLTYLCSNPTNEKITIHDEYNFKINPPKEYLDSFEFLVYRVMLTSYDYKTNKLQYARDLTNILKNINMTYSLPLENLPIIFDIQLDYLVVAKPGENLPNERYVKY